MITIQTPDRRAHLVDATHLIPETAESHHHHEVQGESSEHARRRKQAETTEWMTGDDSGHRHPEDIPDKNILLETTMDEIPQRPQGAPHHQCILADCPRSTTDPADQPHAIYTTIASPTVHDRPVRQLRFRENVTSRMIETTCRMTRLRATRIEQKTHQRLERHLQVLLGIVHRLRVWLHPRALLQALPRLARQLSHRPALGLLEQVEESLAVLAVEAGFVVTLVDAATLADVAILEGAVTLEGEETMGDEGITEAEGNMAVVASLEEVEAVTLSLPSAVHEVVDHHMEAVAERHLGLASAGATATIATETETWSTAMDLQQVQAALEPAPRPDLVARSPSLLLLQHRRSDLATTPQLPRILEALDSRPVASRSRTIHLAARSHQQVLAHRHLTLPTGPIPQSQTCPSRSREAKSLSHSSTVPNLTSCKMRLRS